MDLMAYKRFAIALRNAGVQNMASPPETFRQFLDRLGPGVGLTRWQLRLAATITAEDRYVVIRGSRPRSRRQLAEYWAEFQHLCGRKVEYRDGMVIAYDPLPTGENPTPH